jgi:hypothetical protein
VPLYLDGLRLQTGLYPAHTIKMRCVENHDQLRIMQLAPSRAQALAWTAFQAFNEGAFLIYGGQEAENSHTPDLFGVDKVKWGGYSGQSFLTALCKLKKYPEMVNGRFTLLTAAPAITAFWQAAADGLYGVFNVSAVVDVMPTPLPDGSYVDLISGRSILVRDGEMAVPETAVIVRFAGELATDGHEQPPVLLG